MLLPRLGMNTCAKLARNTDVPVACGCRSSTGCRVKVINVRRVTSHSGCISNSTWFTRLPIFSFITGDTHVPRSARWTKVPALQYNDHRGCSATWVEERADGGFALGCKICRWAKRDTVWGTCAAQGRQPRIHHILLVPGRAHRRDRGGKCLT